MYEANVMPAFHPEWFSQFHYGIAPADRFRVIINFTCGYNSYGSWHDLVGTMRYYTAHRHQYPTLNDFYPEITRCLSNYIDRVE